MFIVEMHRIPKPADCYDLFDCPGPLWDALRKLGESYGWKPAGTIPEPHWERDKTEREERELAELRAIPPEGWEARITAAEERDRVSGKKDILGGEAGRIRWSRMHSGPWSGVPWLSHHLGAGQVMGAWKTGADVGELVRIPSLMPPGIRTVSCFLSGFPCRPRFAARGLRDHSPDMGWDASLALRREG